MSGNFDYAMTPAALRDVEITGGFWRERMEINRTVTLPSMYGRGRKRSGPNAKWLEATAYHLTTHGDPLAQRRLSAAIKAIARRQAEDGFIGDCPPDQRWQNLRDGHVLYGIGHLIEAGVAHYEATGKRKLLEIVCRSADNVAAEFGPGRKQRHAYPGHQEIELALVKLYRATGRRRYLDLAKYFLDERAKRPLYFDIEARARGEEPGEGLYSGYDYRYYQSHLPVREQPDAVRQAAVGGLQTPVALGHAQADAHHRRGRPVGEERGVHRRLRPAQ